MDEIPLSEAHRKSLNKLRDEFASITDPRQGGKVHHPLPAVVLSGLCAIFCGCDDYCSMARFAGYRLDWLREWLPLKEKAPSHDTFRNVFMMIDPDEFVAALSRWLGPVGKSHLAIDGKAIRSSYDSEHGKCLVHLVRAWVDERSLCAGQVACETKSNEIEAIPRLLEALELEGATVTIDAAGCQTAIAEQIDDAGGSYVLTLKANQAQAYNTVKEHFETAQDLSYTMTEELSHGRYEKRECWVEGDLKFFHKSWKWQGLSCVAHIRRETCRPSSRGSDGREATVEDHYYLCSTLPNAENILALVRGHWGIENRCHWTLDVVFGEDASPIRDQVATRNLSTMREVAIHLLRSHPSKDSLRQKRLRAMLDPNFRAEIITKVHA